MQLRELRLARGWSQEQLAERSGLSVRTVQRIENGQAPGLASRAALADALGLTLDALAGDVAPAGSASSTTAPAPAPASSVDAIRMCLTKYADFHGRAARPEYWWFVLFVALAGGGAALVHEVLGALVLLLLAVPILAAGTRRLHDTDRSGWWQLLGLVPFGGVVPLILLAQPSSSREV